MSLLRLYRLASEVGGPLIEIALQRRARQAKEDPARLAERRGRPGAPRPAGPLVWLHGASVGELASVLPLIERIARREAEASGRAYVSPYNDPQVIGGQGTVAVELRRQLERFEDLDPARLDRTFRTNILAMFHLVRHALPHMKAGGVILNTTSIQAYHPNPQILDYAATKGAIRTFTQGLAKELTKRGIRVNAVAPGPIWTPLIPQSFGPEKVKKHGESAPLERAGQPAEVAPVYVFLASDEASYVSGEIVGVTGGSPLA